MEHHPVDRRGRVEGVIQPEAVQNVETGFVSAEMDQRLPQSSVGQSDIREQQPIFQLGRVQYAFPAPLALLTVESNILVMCLFGSFGDQARGNQITSGSTPTLVRIDLDDPERTEEADVPLPPTPRNRAPQQTTQMHTSYAPHRLFADPSGSHTILSLTCGENYYWTTGMKRARRLVKWKGIVVQCISWNKSRHNSRGRPSTKTTAHQSAQLLLGSTAGAIYSASISPNLNEADDGDFLDLFARRGASQNSEPDRYIQQIFKMPDAQAVTGIYSRLSFTNRSSASTSHSAGPGRHVTAEVIMTSNTRIYEFTTAVDIPGGEADDLHYLIFSSLRDGRVALNLRSELPSSYVSSALLIWHPSDSQKSEQMAWATGSGIYHARLRKGQRHAEGNLIQGANLIPFPGSAVAVDPAKASALTEFHVVMLFEDRITAVSSLNDTVALDEKIPLKASEVVLGMTTDTSRQTCWIFTDRSIFELVVHAESRDVWQILLEKGDFEQALRYARSIEHSSEILSAQGDQHCREGRFIQAAQCYAQSTTRPFEEIVLRLVDAQQQDALRYYLVSRLERLRKDDIAQRTMLATWLVEIYLGRIGQLEEIAAAEAASEDVDNYHLEKDLLDEELRQFLSTYRENLDPRTTYRMIAHHGRNDVLLHFAGLCSNYEMIVRHWLDAEEDAKALETIARLQSLDLYYKFAQPLLHSCPELTVTSWIQRPALEPRKLLPALLRYRAPSPSSQNQAVRYLWHIIKYGQNKDAAVHNLAISLLAQGPAKASPQVSTKGSAADAPTLLEFINQSPSDPTTGQPYYDLDYALRTCTLHKQAVACVQIYLKMGLLEDAVQMAIQEGDIELACRCADTPGLSGEEPQRRRKLWLVCAQAVLKQEDGISRILPFLDRTGVLKIDDVLPYFPDFVLIDSFRDQICDTLEAYSTRINGLKEEMDDATRSAEAIQSDMSRLGERLVVVNQKTESCQLCGRQLMDRQFYVFPCRHAFHADCLISETTRHLPPRSLRRILMLQEQLSRLTSGLVPSLPTSYPTTSEPDSHQNHSSSAAVFNVTSAIGLDRLKEYVLSDAVVSAINAGVSVSVASGRRILAPLDPFTEPIGLLRAETSPGPGSGHRRPSTAPQPIHSTVDAARDDLVEELRDDLDALIASACVLCEGAVASIGRSFLGGLNGEKEVLAI